MRAQLCLVFRAGALRERTREMVSIEIVYQSVLPSEQESCSLFCDLLCRPKVRADQFHISDCLSRLIKVIKRDLLFIGGKRSIPRAPLPK